MQSNNFELEMLKSKLSHLKRKAWKPIIQEGDGAITASKFAGKPWLNEGEDLLLFQTVTSLWNCFFRST